MTIKLTSRSKCVLPLMAAVFALSNVPCQAKNSVTPDKCYAQYLNHLYYAQNLDDVSTFWAGKRSTLWRSLDDERKQKKLDYLRSSSYVGNYKVVSDQIKGNNAHLVISGINVDSNKRRIRAIVDADLTKENGYWKIMDAKTSYGSPHKIAAR